MNTLEICKQTRSIASKALFVALNYLFQSHKEISETLLRDQWLSEMRKNSMIFPDGWYMPPPHGIGVLFGNTQKDSRVSYNSLRPKDVWSKDNIILDKNRNEMVYAYASPVTKETGIIGDFGMSLYFGNDSLVKKHLQLCLQLDNEIFEYIEVGKTFAEVFDYAEKKFLVHGFTKPVSISTTDPASINIGHTVPASYEDYSQEELNLLKKGENKWNEIKDMISKKRRFFNATEQITFKKGMAVTIEPRPVIQGNFNIPMASYHTIILIHENGTKELLTNFNEIFQLAGMDYMLN